MKKSEEYRALKCCATKFLPFAVIAYANRLRCEYQTTTRRVKLYCVFRYPTRSSTCFPLIINAEFLLHTQMHRNLNVPPTKVSLLTTISVTNTTCAKAASPRRSSAQTAWSSMNKSSGSASVTNLSMSIAARGPNCVSLKGDFYDENLISLIGCRDAEGHQRLLPA